MMDEMTDPGDQNPIAETEPPLAASEPVPPDVEPEQLLLARLHSFNNRLSAVEHDNRLLLGLLAKLGEIHGTKLKNRQVNGGTMLYWDAAGRIVLP
jgi:hypothetical protein